MIDGIKVEIMGDVQKQLKDGTWEQAVDLKRHKRIVEIEGTKVPVMSLKYEYQAYLKLGRMDKAQTLRMWLNRKDNSSGNS